MRLFITGATGFLGSHVLSAALAAGYEVRALRRHEMSSPVVPLTSQPVWCEGDLSTLQSHWFEGVDAVVHLAAAGVSPKQARWSELVQVNVVGSLQLLEMAKEIGVRRFVVAGTSHEYGNAARRYQAIPPDSPLEPVNAYGATKAAGFQLLRTFAKDHLLELFYGRVFSAYGEGQFEENFWPSLRRAALSGNDFPMTSGCQISDFIPVKTVASHFLQACTRPDISVDSPLVVNIGSGITKSLLAFAQSEWERLGATGQLIPASLPNRTDQIERYVPDLNGLGIPETFSMNAL